MCRRIFKEQTSETGDIPFYKIGTFGADPDAFISRELFEEYKSKYPYPQKGDILISASGSIGRTVEFAGNNEYFQDSNIVWLNHDERLSNPFLKCFYSVVKWAGIEGSTIKRLYNDNILNTVICMPSVPEQKRIGLFFENLDNLITLHQRQHFLHSTPDISLSVRLIHPFYTSSWEQRKLGEMGQTYTGLSGKTKDDFGHGQARFVTYMNVFSNPISNPEMTEPIEIDPKQNEVEVGDVFFTTSSETPEEVGMSSILLEKRGKTYLNSFCFGFRPSEKIDSYYLAYMLRSESTRAKIILLAQGISRYNISKNKVMEIAVSLPSLDEQKMIGQYFSQLDNLITLHQRKFEKLTNVKKSMLEKMFPQNGSSYPEIRFKGFTDPWEQRKAKEICSIGTGKSNTQDQVDDGKYPFYIRSDVPVRSNKYLYDCEAVITIGDGNIGKVFHYVNGKFDLHQRCYKMTDFKDIWGKYFFYYFSTKFYDRAMKMTAKATVDSVRLEMISEMDIKKPPQISEQKQIAEFFANLDNLITLHQRELEKLQNIKKSMLEKMFV